MFEGFFVTGTILSTEEAALKKNSLHLQSFYFCGGRESAKKYPNVRCDKYNGEEQNWVGQVGKAGRGTRGMGEEVGCYFMQFYQGSLSAEVIFGHRYEGNEGDSEADIWEEDETAGAENLWPEHQSSW